MGPARLFPLLLAVLLPAQCSSCQGPPAPAAEGGGGGSSGAWMPRPGAYGVKLCGRNFIRAVIFTCGGSRWRRISEKEEERLPLSRAPATRADLLQASSDEEAENIKLQLLLDLEQPQSARQQTGQQSLKDIFNLQDDYNEHIPISNNLKEYIHQLEDAAHKVKSESWSPSSMGSDHLPWLKYPRRKRDLTKGVAAMCCKWGCTKTEISALC